MQRPLRLLCELFSSASQDDGACLGLRAALKEVIPTGTDMVDSSSQSHRAWIYSLLKKRIQKFFLPVSSDLDLFEEFTLSQHVICHGSHGGLDRATAGLETTLHTINFVHANTNRKKQN